MHNPFVARPAAPVEETWGIAATGPAVDAAEIETAQRAAEVVIMWGDDVLHVAHVSPPRDVVIGEGRSDYLMGKDILGTDRLPIVVERQGQLACVLPEGAKGDVTIEGAKKTFEALEGEGKLAAFGELAGAKLYTMPAGASARVEHRGLTFIVRPTNAGKVIATTSAFRWKHAGWIGLSLFVHGLMLVFFYFMPPQTSALSLDNISAESRLADYILDASEMNEPEVEWTQSEPGESGGSGTQAADEEGQAGDPEHERTDNHFAVRGPRDTQTPQLSRENLRDNIENVTAIGTLRQALGSWNTPTSPYGADQAIGYDEMSAIGALMGQQAGGNFGFGGLGMIGSGRGGGGTGLGTMGVGGLQTIGRCCGGNGRDSGYGNSAGDLGDGRPRVEVNLRSQEATVLGSLPAEAIRRVVRQHLSEVRFCYEQGLTQNPSIEGRVRVSWIIGGDGRVQSSSVADSSLGNARVEQCISQAVRRWSFPQPENGGSVGVNYPFVLQSSN
jgi:TonB family protein